jgi:hypothetical protein
MIEINKASRGNCSSCGRTTAVFHLRVSDNGYQWLSVRFCGTCLAVLSELIQSVREQDGERVQAKA